jgi:DNA-binding HxlR family transcriptional regulator
MISRYGIRTGRARRPSYARGVKSYGQFCSIARALELLGERWTLLVVRELLCGGGRFGDLQRGIPRISRTMLSARLRELIDAGVVTRSEGEDGPAYALTPSGLELGSVVRELGTWGQRWLPRALPRDELDAEALLWDVQRRVDVSALPREPIVVRFELERERPRFLLLRRSEVSLCAANPGFPESLRVGGRLDALTAWWRGDVGFADALRMGLVVEGPRPLTRAFPRWFLRYAFAAVQPAAE